MPRIQYVRPDRPVGQLPVERIIRTGRRQVKQDGRPTFPERLDFMEVCLPGVDPGDAADNRMVDAELMGRLLAEQQRLCPEEPSDRLRAIRVFLAPAATLDGVFGSEFRARTKDGDLVVCKGDGQTAVMRHPVNDQGAIGPLPAAFRPVNAEHDVGPVATTVHCAGIDCPWYARTDATGKQAVYPRCGAEWELRLQIAALDSTFGIVRYRSKSIIGLDEVQGVIDEVQRLVDEGRVPSLSSVPLLLRMKNSRTAHGKQGVWTVYLAFQGPALAMIEAARSAFEEGRVLGAGARPAAALPAHDEPLVRATPATDLPDEPDVEEVEAVDGADDQPPAAEEAPPAPEQEAPPAEQPQPAAKPAPAPGNGAAPSPLWSHARAVALELQGGDEAAADALLRDALAALQDEDSEYPRPTKGGKWAATEAQAQVFEDTMRGLAQLAA